jgi:hypothetical protein
MKTFLAELWAFFKLNFKWILAAVFILVLWLAGCFKRFESQPPTVVHDTVYVHHYYESAPYTPPTINVLPARPTVISQPEYQPDTSSIAALRAQFNALVEKHTQQVVYSETIPIDTMGYFKINDTISENKIASRSYEYDIKEKIITTTITQPYKPRNQVYAGFGVESSVASPGFRQFQLGLQFKNKQDVALGIAGTYTLPNKKFTPQPDGFGVQLSLYKKITLRRQ